MACTYTTLFQVKGLQSTLHYSQSFTYSDRGKLQYIVASMTGGCVAAVLQQHHGASQQQDNMGEVSCLWTEGKGQNQQLFGGPYFFLT